MPGFREGLFFDDIMLLPRRSEVGALVDLEREGVLEWIGSLAEVWTDIIVVDVPQADRLAILRQIQAVKAEYDWLPLMVGNVQTRAGAKDVASLYGRPIICNMGVRSAASVVKALAAGAAAVVLNTLAPDTASQVMVHVATQVRESLSYVGARSIAEVREKAEFIRIRPPYPV